MENKKEQNKKDKYVLLEKPMFFNSKLNKEANQSIEKPNNVNNLNNNVNPISRDNKDKNENNNDNKTKIENNKDNIKSESPKFRCFKVDPNETKWCSRYGRPGYVKSSRNEEDEKYLKEHFQNLEKKEANNFM